MKIILVILTFLNNSWAQECPPLREVQALEDRPYIPQQSDYGLEVGAGFKKQSLYSLGINTGHHVGVCIFTESQTCQQYLDFHLGTAGKAYRNHYMGFASLRWQFINFPSEWSPYFRVLIGAKHSVVPEREKFQDIIYGGGYGVSRYLHPRVDMRFEIRAFQAEVVYSQVFLSFQLKMDEWIKFFGDKLDQIDF